VAWEPQWAVKLRVKSVANAMLGMDMSGMQRGSGRQGQPQGRQQGQPQGQPQDTAPPPVEQKQEEKVDPVNILRGILGR